VPLRYTDHSWGLDAGGKPFDRTHVETVQDFQTLPDTFTAPAARRTRSRRARIR
jgi:hypothetical protein